MEVPYHSEVIVSESIDESVRFSLRIGRALLTAAPTPPQVEVSIEPFDVVVVRAPASKRDVGVALSSLRHHVLIPADHLCHWEWNAARFDSVSTPRGYSVRPKADGDDITRLVIDTFAGYGNHYQANPLLDDSLATAGYCQWVESLLDTGAATCTLLVSEVGQLHGFAVIDWAEDVPDIRLAGVAPSAQGRGLYASILAGVMAEALQRGHDKIEISTQSDNVNVMRAWARLGWLPVRTVATHHLVRRDLLLRR